MSNFIERVKASDNFQISMIKKVFAKMIMDIKAGGNKGQFSLNDIEFCEGEFALSLKEFSVQWDFKDSSLVMENGDFRLAMADGSSFELIIEGLEILGGPGKEFRIGKVVFSDAEEAFSMLLNFGNMF